MTYQPEPSSAYGTPEKTAVLLINLGTPDEPTPPAVRRYLKEFLSDPRVIEMPRALWWLILNGIILNTRPKQSAAKYQSIWTPEGSPHKVHTARLAEQLQGYLWKATGGAPLVVDYAMRYGNPSIPDVLQKLKEQNCQRILAVPLYPQYAASTVATAYDAVFAAMQQMRNIPALRAIKHFPDDDGYIKATAQNIRDYWMKNGQPDKLVMSFHGLPRKTRDQGDPYHDECLTSGRLIAGELGLKEEQYLITFQSRFGREEWLQPYTAATLHELGRQKMKRVDVCCPGFITDCLETLEEIAMEVRKEFMDAGGGEYHYIPCVNERPEWVQALTAIVMGNLQGWLEKADAAELEQGKAMALEANAKTLFIEPELEALNGSIATIDDHLSDIFRSSLKTENPDSLGLFDRSEAKIGEGLVACQIYITKVYGTLQIPMKDALECGAKHHCGITKVKIINHAANYWKHKDAWGLDRTRKQREAIESVFDSIGVPVGTDYPLVAVLTELTAPNAASLRSVIDILVSWKTDLTNLHSQQPQKS